MVTIETVALAASIGKTERSAQFRVFAGWLWSGALLVVLAFLVIYPVAMLLLGALTNTNPVVDGFGVFDSRSPISSPSSAIRTSIWRSPTR